MIPAWASDYVGIPFRDHGRTREGLDCWGLYRLVARERFGLELADFDYVAGDRRSHDGMIRGANDWLPVVVPGPGDAVLFRLGGAACHIGMVLAPGMMLHARDGYAACIERFRSPLWARRLEGFYRHPSRA